MKSSSLLAFHLFFIYFYHLPLAIAIQQIVDLNTISPTYFNYQLSSWTASSTSSATNYTICASKPILGGYGVGGNFQKTYAGLSGHDIIYYQITLYAIDTWNAAPDAVTLSFDSTSISLNNIHTYTKTQNLCGSSSVNDIGRVILTGKILHSASSLTLRFANGLSSGPTVESYGIREIYLSFAYRSTWESSQICYNNPDSTGSSSGDCPCAMGQFSSWWCMTCSSVCESCYNSGAGGCFKCATGYYHDGAQCLACSSSCTTCSNSASFCTSCPAGKYLMRNGTCASSCSSPLTPINDSSMYYCVSSCSSSQFLYWNGSCLASCASYLNSSVSFGDKYCNYICGATQYLLMNGTCSNTCPSPFKSYVEAGKNYCTFGCSGTNFYYTNGSCLPSCNAPFISLVRGVERYCYFPCSSTQFYLSNGTCWNSCSGNFNSRSVSTIENYCTFSCANTTYRYANGSCLSGCSSPFVPFSIGLEKYCNFPCTASQFYYTNGSCLATCGTVFTSLARSSIERYCSFGCGTTFRFSNGTCTSTCSSPFTSFSQGIEKYCNFPCSSGVYYYSNGTCSVSCPSSFVSTVRSSIESYCNFSCPTTRFYYSNGTCLSYCSSPFSQFAIGVEKYCNFACTNSQFLLTNGSCYSTCPSDTFSSIIKSTVEKYCNFSCPDGFYYYPNGTCLSYCISPFVSYTVGLEKYCYFACPSSQYLFSNGSCYSTCPNKFSALEKSSVEKYCNFNCQVGEYYYANGTCISHCPSPFSSFTIGVETYCDFACTSTQFYLLNSSCFNTCPSTFSPIVKSPIEQYCNFSCQSDEYYYGNGTCMASCSSPFSPFSVGLEKYCNFACTSSQFLLPNGTCFDSCNLPWSPNSLSSFENYCDFSCQSGEMWYLNGTCSSDCPAPFFTYNQALERYCLYPCSTSEYLYENGTCLPSCPFPFYVNGTYYKTCTHPCNQSLLFFDGTCIKYCNSSYVKNEDLYTCTVCPLYQYRYENSTCQTTCTSPMTNRSIGFDLYCDMPCSSSEFYFAPNSSCISTCPYPLRNHTINYPECYRPCPNAEDFYDEELDACHSSCNPPNIANYSLAFPTCKLVKIVPINPTVEKKAETTKTLTQLIAKGSVLGSIISSAAEAGGGMAIIFVIMSKFLYCSRFIKVNYTQDALDFFAINNKTIGFGIDWAAPEGLKDLVDQHAVDKEFRMYGIYASFLENIWDDILSIVTIFVIIGLILVVEKLSIKYKWRDNAKFYLSKIKELFKWNILLLYFCSIYSNIFIYSLVGYQSSKSFDSAVITLGVLLTIPFIGVAIWVLVFCFKTAKKVLYLNAKVFPDGVTDTTVDKQALYAVGFLYKDFNEEKFWSLNFLFSFLIREIIFDFVIVLISIEPMAQVVLILLSGFLTMLFLILYRPFKDLFENIKFAICEIVLLINFVCVAQLSVTPDLDIETRESLATMMINCYLAFTLIVFIFMLISIIAAIAHLIKIGLKLKKENRFTIRELVTKFLEIPAFERVGLFFNMLTRLKRKGRLSNKNVKIGNLVQKLQTNVALVSSPNDGSWKGTLISSKFQRKTRNSVDHLLTTDIRTATAQTPREEHQLINEDIDLQVSSQQSSKLYFGIDASRVKPLLTLKIKNSADLAPNTSADVSHDDRYDSPMLNLSPDKNLDESNFQIRKVVQSVNNSRRGSEQLSENKLSVSVEHEKLELSPDVDKKNISYFGRNKKKVSFQLEEPSPELKGAGQGENLKVEDFENI